MSISFLQSLELGQYLFRNGSLTVAHQDGQVDASLVLQFMAWEISKKITDKTGEETKLLLVLNHQSKSHWISIATKLGWNLNALKEKQQLAIVDTLQEAYNYLRSDNEQQLTEDDSILDQTTGFLSTDRLLHKCLREIDILYPQNVPVLEHSSGEKKPKLFIILEDFTSLIHCANESEKGALEFLRCLRFPRSDLDTSLVTLVSSNENDSKGRYFENLVSQSLSSLTFHVSQLRTGFSSEVNGLLTVAEHEKVIRDAFVAARRTRSYHYKLLDRSVKFTPL